MDPMLPWCVQSSSLRSSSINVRSRHPRHTSPGLQVTAAGDTPWRQVKWPPAAQTEWTVAQTTNAGIRLISAVVHAGKLPGNSRIAAAALPWIDRFLANTVAVLIYCIPFHISNIILRLSTPTPHTQYYSWIRRQVSGVFGLCESRIEEAAELWSMASAVVWAYSGGLRAEPPVGFRGQSPWSGGWARSRLSYTSHETPLLPKATAHLARVMRILSCLTLKRFSFAALHGLLQVYLSDQVHVLACCFSQLLFTPKSSLHFNYFSKKTYFVFSILPFLAKES